VASEGRTVAADLGEPAAVRPPFAHLDAEDRFDQQIYRKNITWKRKEKKTIPEYKPKHLPGLNCLILLEKVPRTRSTTCGNLISAMVIEDSRKKTRTRKANPVWR